MKRKRLAPGEVGELYPITISVYRGKASELPWTIEVVISPDYSLGATCRAGGQHCSVYLEPDFHFQGEVSVLVSESSPTVTLRYGENHHGSKYMIVPCRRTSETDHACNVAEAEWK